MSKRIGVVADDVTGANDIGIMFKNGGYRSAVFPLKLLAKCKIEDEVQGLDVIIIDTDTRFADTDTAKAKVAQATDILKKLHCDRYINKTCSVFRGNIGAEFDSMQDALGIECSMVIAGFPKNGRTTVDGIHYVYGTRLEESQFKNDPIHPMNTSSLTEIMHKQTSRKIELISWKDLDQGLEFVKNKKEMLKKNCSYILFDVRNQEDLKLIAQAVADEINLCGSSAIGEELPGVFRDKRDISEPVFLIAGSLTVQSVEQTQAMRTKGYSVFELDTEKLLSGDSSEEEKVFLMTKAAMEQARVAMIHSSQEKDKIHRTKEIGISHGLSHEEIGQCISGCLCRITRRILEETGCKNLVVAGGDTSAAITEELGIFKMEICEEIEAGVPAMKGKSELGELSLVLKSGSFGSREFLEKAAICLCKG